MKYNFPKNLKLLRENANLSLNDIGKSIGITRQTLSNYENEKSIPDIFILSKLSAFFNCSIESLVYEQQLDESIKDVNDIYIENLIGKINKILNININPSDEDELIKFLYSKKELLNNKISKMNTSISETQNIIIELDKLIDAVNLNKNKSTSNSKLEFSEDLTLDIENTYKSFISNLNSYKKIININNKKYTNTVEIPFYGNISAGCPRPTFNDLKDAFNIPSQLIESNQEYFILKISGESMNKIYQHNDYVLVKKYNHTTNYFRVPFVVSVDGSESTVKFIEIDTNNHTFSLIPYSTDKSFKVQTYSFDNYKLEILGSIECIIRIEKD